MVTEITDQLLIVTLLGSALTGIMEGDFNVSFRKTDETSTAFEKSSDFIWAIRVTQVSKHFLSSQWGYKTYVSGATYSTEEDESVEELLSQEGFDRESIEITETDVFVLPTIEDA